MPDVGATLAGRYKLLDLLGRGGMADVYRALDHERGVEVAVKVMRADYAEEPEFVKRFGREAQALSRLDHPNIVRFYSFEQDGRTAFIVMDCVRGDTLRGRLRDAGGPLPLDETTRILHEVGAALSFAHRRGYLHRDIKPANIMIDEHGRALLSDFGIAKAAETTTTTHVGAGTPAYMSPEQILGTTLDARTDVYSLGVVLYGMVAGRRPFVGDVGTGTTTPARVQDEHLHVSPPDPRQFRPHLPADIATVVVRALAKDPDLRWPDVPGLMAAWETAGREKRSLETERPTGPQEVAAAPLNGKPRASMPALPSAATPRSPSRSVAKAGSSSRYEWLMVPFYLGVVLGIFVLLYFLGRTLPSDNSRATPTVANYVLASTAAVGSTPTAARPATATGTTPAADSQSAGTPGRVGTPTVESLLPTPTPYPSATPKPATAKRQPSPTGEPSATPQPVAMATAAPTLSPAPASSTAANRQLEGPGHIAFTSDRDGNYEIYTMAADGSGQARLISSPGSDLAPAWSPDGSRIAFTSERDGNREIYLADADGSDLVRLTDDAAVDANPAWSPDGSRIAFQSNRGGDDEIYMVNADGSNLTRITSNPGTDWEPSWSPDGSRIAFASDRDGNMEVYVMNVDGDGLVRLTNAPGVDGSPAFSPDGTRIAFMSERDGNYEIYLMGIDGSDPIRLTNNPAWDGSPAWSPDGSRIAFHSSRDSDSGIPLDIYTMNADGSAQTRLTNSPGVDAIPDWSPD